MTVRPAEAKIIRDLADRCSQARRCAHSRPTSTRVTYGPPPAGRWAPTPLRRMLRSGRISGQREHQGEIVADATWPAIITPEQTARIRVMLDDPARQATRPARSYLLKGLVRCGHCDAVLVSRPRDDGARRYVCATGPRYHGCGRTYVLAEPLEQFVTGAVLHRLDTPELARAIRGARDDAATSEHAARLDELTARMDELAAAYAGGAVSMREWLAAREPLQRQLDAAPRQLAAREMGSAAGTRPQQALRKRWGDLGRRGASRGHRLRARACRGRSRSARPEPFRPWRFRLVWRY